MTKEAFVFLTRVMEALQSVRNSYASNSSEVISADVKSRTVGLRFLASARRRAISLGGSRMASLVSYSGKLLMSLRLDMIREYGMGSAPACKSY